MCCRWDASLFPCVTGAMIEWDCFCLQILVFSSLSSALFSIFVVCDQYITVETPFLFIIQPPLYKELWMFLCIVHHLQFSFTKSSIIELSSFDLKVSQVSFSVIEENPIVLDSRLHCYSCIWFELVVFQVSKESFQFQIAKCLHCLHFVLKRSLLLMSLWKIIQICA